MMAVWKGATVLIVDDEELVTLELVSLFSELGFKVCGTASTATDALRMAEELTPRLITMDINLGAPGEGLAAVTLVRTSDLTTPVLFITGGLDADRGDAILTLGRSDFVQKPFARSDIINALSRLMTDDDAPMV